MSVRTKPITIRLAADQVDRFLVLAREFAGLTPAAVLRMLIAAQLERPLEEQVAIVTSRVRGGTLPPDQPARAGADGHPAARPRGRRQT